MLSDEEREALPCDHYGECPPDRSGCRWVQFEREYVHCACGGWDEFWSSRSSSVRLPGRSNHGRRCIAADAARAAERALVERINAVLPSPEWFEKNRQHVRQVYSDASERGFLIGSLNVEEALVQKVRAALRPEAATTEGAVTCQHCGKPIRRLGSSWEHYSPTWQGRRCPGTLLGATPAAARPSSTRGGDDAAAVHPDTEGER